MVLIRFALNFWSFVVANISTADFNAASDHLLILPISCIQFRRCWVVQQLEIDQSRWPTQGLPNSPATITTRLFYVSSAPRPRLSLRCQAQGSLPGQFSVRKCGKNYVEPNVRAPLGSLRVTCGFHRSEPLN